MAITDGKLTDQQFERNRFKDADIVALLGKTKAVGSDDLNQRFPRGRPAIIEVELADGTRHRAEIDVPLGDAARPFDEKTVTAKFRELADPIIGAAGARRVVELVENLDTLTSLEPLMSALRRPT